MPTSAGRKLKHRPVIVISFPDDHPIISCLHNAYISLDDDIIHGSENCKRRAPICMCFSYKDAHHTKNSSVNQPPTNAFTSIRPSRSDRIGLGGSNATKIILIGLVVVTAYCVAYYGSGSDCSKGFGAFERYVRRRDNRLVFFKSEVKTFFAEVGLLILAIRNSLISRGGG